MRPLTSFVAAVLVAAAPSAFAQGASHPDLARSLAATCANCHGTGGKAATNTQVPSLAGRSKEEIARLMTEFRDGKRTGTIMHQLAKGYTPEQIDAMAAWFAAQK